MHSTVIERVINFLDPDANLLLNTNYHDAVAAVGSGDPARVREIDGQFALLAQDGHIIRMARSIGRPMRYFLAKQQAGPCLIVSERMDEIAAFLKTEGLADQFHPSYTRMVPAHFIVELALVGCPDPNPINTRYFSPTQNVLPTSIDVIGEQYVGAVAREIDLWLDRIPETEPIGVLFSGGIDSGAVLVLVHDLLIRRGQAPTRLKAFTLSVGGTGRDAAQAEQFLAETDLSMFLEVIDVPPSAVDFQDAVRVIEDYKPLDVQAAAMNLALCRGIRERYPAWKHLIDGDGGDENLKDYPIEENPELTIRSVLNNVMLYHEGWGVDAVKHSLTYSGGQSRGHVRTSAPAKKYGFHSFSPFALPNVIEVSEGIPFVDLTEWDHERLYRLKGEVVRQGVEAVTGRTIPIFEKRRFQDGAADEVTAGSLFPVQESAYREAFGSVFHDGASNAS